MRQRRGLDRKEPIALDVRDVFEANQVESGEEFSEPDENSLITETVRNANDMSSDSMVGHLQVMKTDIPAPPLRKRGAPVVDEDDEESDINGEVDDDTRKTDTENKDEDFSAFGFFLRAKNNLAVVRLNSLPACRLCVPSLAVANQEFPGTSFQAYFCLALRQCVKSYAVLTGAR